MISSILDKVKMVFSKDPELEKEKIREQVFTQWINNYLQQKGMKIDKIDDLIDGNNWITLAEILWNDKINHEIDKNTKAKDLKLINYKKMIKHLETKNIIKKETIPTEKIIKKDLLDIVWIIISKYSIDWIDYYGLKGQNGLLKWCNSFTDDNFQNFYDSWENGKTICLILHHFYSKDVNLTTLDNMNEPTKILEYTISILQKSKAPIFISNNFIQFLDEKSLIIQYAVLFDYLSKENVLNSAKFYNNEKPNQITNNIQNTQDLNINYYNPNSQYTLYEQPDFHSGSINVHDLNDFILNKDKVIDKINGRFKKIMYPRYPVQIASIINDNNKLKVQYNFDKFEHIIQYANQRPIIFVSCLGRYQQGKSTLISGITGNIGYKIGKGNKETTKGVYIDGPYNIDYLYKRFKVQMRKNMYFGGNELLSPLIFFFDIEGYDGNMHGNDIQENNKAFIEMCTPFLCLSSIFLFLSEPNANIYEIVNFLERMKVSNLTTYSSNDDESNGALQLHIIFNKYNKIANELTQKTPNSILSAINEFNNTFKNEWIGGEQLNKYGIIYDFIPIAEGLNQYYNDDSFFTFFRYFAIKLIRSIENATEGSFVRCGPQSISLFKYIVQHFNQPLFENKIKQLIKEEHESSFHTLSNRAYAKSCEKIFPCIDREFENYEQNFLLDVDVDEIKKKYTSKGDIIIKKELNVVIDHPDVVIYIEQFSNQIITKIDEKYDHYCKLKNDLITKNYNQFDQFIQQKTLRTVEIIFSELAHNKNFQFNQSQISNFINNKTNDFRNCALQYKNENNLLLISDNSFNQIISEKKTFFEDTINNYINREKDNTEKLRDEIKVSTRYFVLQKLLIRKKYNLRAIQLLNDLNQSLTSPDFYISNYCNQSTLIDEYQNSIYEYISSKSDEFNAVIFHTLIKENSNNKIVIERINQKKRLTIDSQIIYLIINQNHAHLIDDIKKAFDSARINLAEIKYDYQRTRASINMAKIESKKITNYPDGISIESDWTFVRYEKRHFSEILDDIGQCIIKSITIVMDSVTKVLKVIHYTH